MNWSQVRVTIPAVDPYERPLLASEVLRFDNGSGCSSHITSKTPTKPIVYLDVKSVGTAKYTVNFYSCVSRPEYILAHSLAHALMTGVALDCG